MQQLSCSCEGALVRANPSSVLNCRVFFWLFLFLTVAPGRIRLSPAHPIRHEVIGLDTSFGS